MKITFSKIHVLMIAAVILIGVSMTLAIKARYSSPTISANNHKEHKNDDVYSCPMHPSIISKSPGLCPICHMELQKVERDESFKTEPTSGNKKERKIIFYRHPMKPEITSPVPAKDEMGMDFIPVYEDTEESTSKEEVAGRAGFSLSKNRQQLIGVTKGKVEIQNLEVEVRASGKVAFDPDLFTAIEEYRLALNSASEMKENPYAGLRAQGQELAESAKTKLRLLGLTERQIHRLAQTQVSPMNLLLPKGNVWIYAEIFEYELTLVKEGLEVEVTTPSNQGKKFKGKLTSISPIVNPQTRTARVRALIPDLEGVLRPDTFVNVKILARLGERLVIPADAVLHSGEDAFAFVIERDNQFEPRRISLGIKARDVYEVTEGLKAGETVVTSANFLIDSESRLRGVLKNMESKKALEVDQKNSRKENPPGDIPRNEPLHKAHGSPK